MAFNFQSLSILIADDDPTICEITAKILRKWDFKRVDTAQNGAEGFDLFSQHNHDLVVTDCLMEPMDGIELIKKIRNDDESPNKYVPIIATTGYTSPDFIDNLRDSGVTELLVKPFSTDDLTKRIVYMLNKPRQFVESKNFFGPDRRRREAPDYDGPDRRKGGSHE